MGGKGYWNIAYIDNQYSLSNIPQQSFGKDKQRIITAPGKASDRNDEQTLALISWLCIMTFYRQKANIFSLVSPGGR